MRSGDYIFKPSGVQWCVAFVLNAKDVEGLADGQYVFAVRPIKVEYGHDIIYCLLPVETLGWASASFFDKGDICELAGETFAIHAQRGMFMQLRREDGSREWTVRWRVAFQMMCGFDVPLDADWREARPEEI